MLYAVCPERESEPLRSEPLRSDPLRSDPLRSEPRLTRWLFLSAGGWLTSFPVRAFNTYIHISNVFISFPF